MKKKVIRTLYLIMGILALVSGILGIFLPILPTTPFLLLATYCFSKSSKRMHDWITSHKVFGPPIRDWNKYRVIGIRAKIFSLSTISVGLISVYISFPERLWIGKYLTLACMLAVMVFISLQKSKRDEDEV